jgi:hypothetical protein
MYTNTLPGNTSSILQNLKNTDFIRNFYLSGGTSLALQIGHRESQDLDFFNQNDFQPELIQRELESIGKLKDITLDRGTLNCFLDNVKLQFLYYPYKLLEPKIIWENISLSSKLDLALTKLITISSRGNKKDFIDMYFLLKEYDLQNLFVKLKDKYSNSDYNETHILKSLVYFVDADQEPMPRMHKEIDWEIIKEEIINRVKIIKI